MSTTTTISSLFGDLKKLNNEQPAIKKESASIFIKPKSNVTKRTFEIRNEAWADFALLASADNKTLNEYISDLIEKEVKENAGFLEQLKNRRK